MCYFVKSTHAESVHMVYPLVQIKSVYILVFLPSCVVFNADGHLCSGFLNKRITHLIYLDPFFFIIMSAFSFMNKSGRCVMHWSRNIRHNF